MYSDESQCSTQVEPALYYGIYCSSQVSSLYKDNLIFIQRIPSAEYTDCKVLSYH